MLSHNGTNYAPIVFAAAVFVLLAAGEYFLCRKTKRPLPKFILLLVPAVFLVLIPFCMAGSSGGFVDLRGFAAAVLFGCAAISALAVGTGWIISKLKK